MAEGCKHDHSEGLLAHREEYILEIDPDPRTNLERVAQALGWSTDVHEYADPRRVAQELAEGVMHTYEVVSISLYAERVACRGLSCPQSHRWGSGAGSSPKRELGKRS